MSRTITWLHLSDRHTNSPRTGWDADAVIETLVKDLKRLQREHELRPDLIFFTGDLAWGQVGAKLGESLADQFAEGHRLLEAVRTVFTPAIPRENVFLVPGNHDVDRGLATPQLTNWLDGIKDGGIVTEMIRKGDHEWSQYAGRLRQYTAFLETHGYTHLLADKTRVLYTSVREVSGKKIGIAGFNSAWSCCRDNEKGRLWTGGSWQAQTLAAELKGTDVKIALVHQAQTASDRLPYCILIVSGVLLGRRPRRRNAHQP